MPHLFTEKLDLIETPSSNKDVSFDFIAKSYNIAKDRHTEYKISSTINNKEFLLNYREKDDKFLLKADLITRISPVGFIKNTLNAYVDATNSNVISSNTSNVKIRDDI